MTVDYGRNQFYNTGQMVVHSHKFIPLQRHRHWDRLPLEIRILVSPCHHRRRHCHGHPEKSQT